MEKAHLALLKLLPASSALLTGIQVAAILLIALVAGATFGIWRGYNPTDYSALTFLETHQGAVRGLNTLIPAMALAAIILTLILLARSYGSGLSFSLYLIAVVLMIGGGVITRLENQPINAIVMTWSVDTMPTTWVEIRDNWWMWHVIRTFVSVAAVTALITAVLTDRPN
ncbi:MAG: DUF1772 domain-containing protein [Sneathiella sp.]|nr:DUF1772 domain-containing protein [Sneathiella sp.]